jgi:hypothetical protein
MAHRISISRQVAFSGSFLHKMFLTHHCGIFEFRDSMIMGIYMRRMKWIAPLVIAAALGLVFSCTLFGPKGSLAIELTDWPLLNQEVTAVNVTITMVEVRQVTGTEEETDEEAGWLTVVEPNEEFNLLELQDGATASLGASELPVGTYTEIRLHVDDSSTIEFEGDITRYPLTIPSGTSSGVKIKYTFTISDTDPTVITLDFDAQQSVKINGGTGTEYQMHPVVRVKE